MILFLEYSWFLPCFKGAVNGMFVVPPCSINLRLLFVLLTNVNRLKFKDVIQSKYFETICTFKSYSTSQWLYSPIPKIKEHYVHPVEYEFDELYRGVFFWGGGLVKKLFILYEIYFKRVAWSWPYTNYINLFFTGKIL